MPALPTTHVYPLMIYSHQLEPPMTLSSSSSKAAAATTPHPSPHILFSIAPRRPSSRQINNIIASSTAIAGNQAGIPFSWEDLPGIPKKQPQQLHRKSDHLPLPPAPPKDGPTNSRGGARDPFMAALLECSRDAGGDRQGHIWKKVGRSVIQRFSISPTISIHQFSCQRSCGVSDSVVFLPRPRRPLSYDKISKGSG